MLNLLVKIILYGFGLIVLLSIMWVIWDLSVRDYGNEEK